MVSSWHKKAIKIVLREHNLQRIIGLLQAGTTLEDLLETEQATDISAAPALANLLLSLYERGLLCEPVDSNLSSDTEDRFNRVLGFLAEFETPTMNRYAYLELIRNSSVLVVGFGSTGTSFCGHLLAAGVGRLHLVDGGIVTLAALGRQPFFQDSDCGKNKVAVGVDRLSGASRYTQTTGTTAWIQSHAQFEQIIRAIGPSIVVLSADIPVWEIAHWASAAAQATNTALLRVNRFGVGPLFIPGKTACPMCAWPPLAERVPRAATFVASLQASRNAPAAALSTTTAMAAAIAAREVICFVAGLKINQTENQRIRISDIAGEQISVEPFPQDSRCSVCAR